MRSVLSADEPCLQLRPAGKGALCRVHSQREDSGLPCWRPRHNQSRFAFERKVDVLTDEGLKPRIREQVLREAVEV